MRNITIGNDISFSWTVKRNGAAENFSNVSAEVNLYNQFGVKCDIEYSITGNVITGVFRGKDQKKRGVYVLELVENKGKVNMNRIDHVKCWNLVEHTYQEGGSDCSNLTTTTVALTTEITVPSNGIGIASITSTKAVGDGGINTVTITLDSGSAHTFEVKNGSKGDKGEKGDKGDTGERGLQGIQGVKGDTGVGISSVTPSISISDEGRVVRTQTIRLTNNAEFDITSIDGLDGERGQRGEKGEKGDTGESGSTPVITTSKSNGVTTIYADGVAIGTINDGSGGSLTPEQTAKIADIDNKVDKVTGKGLSTNDYTNADKTQVGKVADLVRKVGEFADSRTKSVAKSIEELESEKADKSALADYPKNIYQEDIYIEIDSNDGITLESRSSDLPALVTIGSDGGQGNAAIFAFSTGNIELEAEADLLLLGRKLTFNDKDVATEEYVDNKWQISDSKCGTLADLTTTDKSSLVKAINEVNAKPSGSGSEPSEYIKSASVNGNTLTLTKKDNTTQTFTPSTPTWADIKPSDGVALTDLASTLQTSISRADEIYNDYVSAQNLI